MATVSGAGDARELLESQLKAVRDSNTRARIAIDVLAGRFDAHGLSMTVVGGSAVALWDPLAHVSRDIDLVGVATERELDAVFCDELGFEREGRHWVDETLAIAVEVPAWTLEPDGAEAVLIDEILVISLEDLILDRVDQWHATGAFEASRQAGRLLAHELLDEERLERRAAAVGTTDALAAVRALAERGAHADSPLSHKVHELLDQQGIAAALAALSQQTSHP